MELKIIENINDQEWDSIIEKYEIKSLFHQSNWLNFLKETQKIKIIKFKIQENNKIIGYFVGMLEQKGPFKIFSSPRPGCNTPHMGPIVNKDFDQKNFINALEKYCKSQKIDQLEISSPLLKPGIMKKNNFRYRRGITYIVNLDTEEKMWRNLKKKSCRYSIHKAEKNGLTAEKTNDPKIIEKYYEQLKEVFGKQGLFPTYSKQRIVSLFKNLKDSMFCVWVKNKDIIVATGFFPYNKKSVYFFGGASWLKYQYLCPNELLHWTLMKLSAQRKIKYYDMGGKGGFKPKFGGELIITYRWYKSYNPLANLARMLYQNGFKIIQKIKGLKHGKLSK